MKILRLYIGTKDKDTKEYELPNKTFRNLFDKLFKNYTLFYGLGKYTHEDDTVITEDTFILHIAVANYSTIDIFKETIGILKKELNQESIMAELDNEVYFI